MASTYPATLYTGPDAQRTAATRWVNGDLFVVQATGVLWARVAGNWQNVAAGAAAFVLVNNDELLVYNDELVYL